MTFASDTNVSINRTREEIIRTLERYGADGFGFMTEGDRSAIYFRIEGIRVNLHVSMPDYADFETTPNRRTRRSEDAQQRAYDQACRQRWRAQRFSQRHNRQRPVGGVDGLSETLCTPSPATTDWPMAREVVVMVMLTDGGNTALLLHL